jgi:hypothetical protein
MAEMIVGRALLGVLQDLIGLADLLEANLGAGVLGVAVGMAFLGKPPVGRLDLLIAGSSGEAQDLVVAAL